MAGHTLCYFGSGRWRRAASPMPRKACQVPADFFGLCVANAPESSSDSYVIARLNELGIRHVRLDFTYSDREAYTERFLDRLLSDRFQVCLHLVQPREEARVMPGSAEAAERWRSFIGEMFDRYGSRLALIEIGATCNRRKWSGYSPAAFFAAWQIAWEEARGRDLAIAGPNITDFEPVYNAGWLGEMRRSGMLPGTHTDNLFVERATEPEAFDRKIGGARLAGALRFNLVRKARLLQDIGAWAGAPSLMCTHVTWSLRRIARFLEDVEGKQADYLARYACLAAASGALTRVYWGPLIGQREGLIDDGTSEYPEIPHVTYYEQARGEIKNYRLRPAYRTFRAVNRLLAGSTFKRCLATGAGLEMLEFELPGGSGEEKQTPNIQHRTSNAQCRTTDDGHLQSEIENRKSKILHAVWTTDGNGAGSDACYPPELLDQAEIYSRDGERLDRAPRMFSESPVFLVWKAASGKRQEVSDGSNAESALAPLRLPLRASIIPGFRFARQAGWDFDVIRPEADAGRWTGVYLAEAGGERVDIQALMALLRQSNAECRMQNAELADSRDQRSEVRGQKSKISNQQPARNAAHPPAALRAAMWAGSTAGGSAISNSANAQCRTTACPAKPWRSRDESNLQSKIENLPAVLPDRAPRIGMQAGRKSKILRAARNFVWSTSAPWNADRTIVIKEFKPRPLIRRILEWRKPNKAIRSWNGAQELLRRGLHTPVPIACLLPAKTARRGPSFYICEAFAPAWSVRDAFTAFSAGATAFQGQSAADLYEAIADFLQKLHTRGVYFRDLSAGNLLFRRTASGETEFALIDTARARFHRHSLGLRLRLCDLMRICHPLDWPGRRVFADKYLAHNGRRFRWWMKIPFRYYDWKHRVKNALKRR